MKENLITLAILTYAKAQILKNVLESNGIQASIQNINQIQPMISAGVRVRIYEKDLPKALMMVESEAWLSEHVIKEEDLDKDSHGEHTKDLILVPVDFSDHTLKVIQIAFNMAHRRNAEVVLVHVYFAPIYSDSLPFYGDVIPPQLIDGRRISDVLKHVQVELDVLSNKIKTRIAEGVLPDIPYRCKLREGIPEEEIIKLCREEKAQMIIMGMRGKDQREHDLIGSVTAEVFDRSRVPILAIPEECPFTNLAEIRHVGFMTNFSQRDLISIDAFVKRLKGLQFKMSFIHLEDKNSTVDTGFMDGMCEYLRKQYPEFEIDCHLVTFDHQLQHLDEFISSQDINMLVSSAHRRTVFSRLFNPSIAKRMIFHANTPLLILYF